MTKQTLVGLILQFCHHLTCLVILHQKALARKAYQELVWEVFGEYSYDRHQEGE